MNETWWVSKEQLIGEQLNVIDLPLDGSYLILGPPGSGKTNLLLLRANYLYLAGHHDISVIVFTRTLQEFLAAGAGQYDFPSEKISTSTKWFGEFLRSFGREVPRAPDFNALRKMLLSEVQKLIVDKGLSKIHEVILLDEAQDYWPEELQVFAELSSKLFIVADARQQIYSADDPLAVLSSLVDKTRVLKHHFRNGLKICRLADHIMRSTGSSSMESTSHYDETARPSSVDPYKVASLADQTTKILENLDLQRKTYPDELLGVCCPLREDVNAVWAAIQETALADVAIVQKADTHCEFKPDTRVCVSTIHAAKGLEFRALHLAGLEALQNFSFSRNVAFTAVTRAKTSLSLYYSSKIPTFLGSAIQKLQPPPPMPTVAAAFGRRK
jgi:superfamily I DNA/RNA helicase